MIGRTSLVLAVLSVGVVFAVTTRSFEKGDDLGEFVKAAMAEPLPSDVDTLTSLDEARRRIEACSSSDDSACAGVVYVWSPVMPLSRLGIRDIARATDELGVELTVVGASELYGAAGPSSAESPVDGAEASPEDARGAPSEMGSGAVDLFAAELVAAGATTHYPAIVVHQGGRILRSAILGYKTAETYQAMIAQRLGLEPAGTPAEGLAMASDGSGDDPDAGAERAGPGMEGAAASEEPSASTRSGASAPAPPLAPGRGAGVVARDFPIDGSPGPYFRYVPGRSSIAYEAGRVVYLLDLEQGGTMVGPGYIDFVPTPDGRFFVTPGQNRIGLYIYDAEEVYEEAAKGRGQAVEPIFVDREMKDQYPSVGILRSSEENGTRTTVYRVLTAWYDQVIYRDYEIRTDLATGRHTVQPEGESVAACSNYQVSIPIMAQDGREVAGRDEETATTKIFRFREDGNCDEVVDLGLPTGKVAWGPDGRRLAFAIPRGAVRDGSRMLWVGRGDEQELAGIFVFDREDLKTTRVAGSQEVNRLAFPDFVGRDSVIFLISASSPGEKNRFRLVGEVR